MTLRRTATVAVVSVSLLLLLLLVQLIRSGDTTRRLDGLSAQANGITATVSSLDHLVYEYLLQPHARPAQQWRLLSAQLGGQLDDLEAAGGDAAAVAGLRRELGKAHELFEALVDEMKGGGPDQAALAARRSRIAEQMLLGSRAMSQEAARIHRLAIRQRATVQSRDSLIAIGALAATFGMLAWLLMHVRRRVLLPLDALQRSTERVSAGNLDQQPGDMRADEIGDLARAFDRMVGQLRESRRLLQAEESKRAGEERQRQLIDALPGLVWAARPDGASEAFNRAWRTQLGVDADAPGFDWTALLHPDDASLWRQTWKRALAGAGPIQCQFRLDCRGEWRWHLARVAPLCDAQGRLVLWVGTAADIHQHKDLEDHLRRSRNQAELLNQAGLDLVAEVDVERLCQRVTAAATALAGADFGALFLDVSDSDRDGPHLHHVAGLPATAAVDFPPLELAALFPTEYPGQAIVRCEDVLVDPRYAAAVSGHVPGGMAVRSYLAVPLRTRSGRIIGGIYCAHAQPGRFSLHHERLVAGIAALAAIALDNARLFEGERRQRRLADNRAGELARSNAELEQFAYICSHDLQEPLRMISSFLGLLEERYREQLDERGRGFIARAVAGASRMQNLIRDILSFSRVSRGERAEERLALREALDEALSNLQPQLDAAHATVEVGILPVVRGNRLQFLQLFQNLVGNALKFTDGRPPLIRIAALREESGWRVSVADNGIGIAPEHHRRIFQVFQRLHGRERFEGTGIGLSLCEKIVLAHGGTIGVESQPGEGATFWFTLPDGDTSGVMAAVQGTPIGDGIA